jgi:hypothetical protein
MERSSKRGKIPQSDWPLIMARYEAGETLASIARTYDCSPPAISYVVSRSRARHPAPETAAKPPGGSEPQLIKSGADGAAIAKSPMPATQASANGTQIGHAEPAPTPLAGRPAGFPPPPDSRREPPDPPRETNGVGDHRPYPDVAPPPPGIGLHDRSNAPEAAPRAADGGNGATPGDTSINGDQRRTLHLSLGNPTHDAGGGHPADGYSPERPNSTERAPQRPQFAAPPPGEGQDRAAPNGLSDIRPIVYPQPAGRNDGAGAPRKDVGSFIDHELRARVDGDIAVFLAAFDAALLNDTQESRSALREATDRLLRAGARTRIELERLEARMPLPSRDGRASDAAWRNR